MGCDMGASMLAVIPARRVSKGFPNKHLRLLGGCPVIDWTIEAAKDASSVSHVVVTSDDYRVLERASELGVEPLRRDASLCGHDVASDPVVLDAVKRVSGSFEWVVLLQPTSPLRTAADIDEAMLSVGDADMVISVFAPAVNPWKCFYTDQAGGLRGIVSDDAPFQPRQRFPTPWAPNGAICAIRTQTLLREQRLRAGRMVGHVMPSERSVYIDSEADLRLAQQYMEANRKKIKYVISAVPQP